MKKRFLAIISTVLALLVSLSIFSGCNLFTKDNERDMAQVVATVEITEKEDIYKRDMVMAYLNYGYMYVQYYGYTQEKTFNLILDNLINTRILVQNVKKEFEVSGSIEDYLKTNYNDNYVEAKYNAYKGINDLLDSYAKSDEAEKKGDAITYEVRTIPTNAKNAEEEVNKKEYVEKYEAEGFDTTSSEYRRNALVSVYKLMKNNGLLGDGYKDNDLRTTRYFNDMLNDYYESELIEIYEKKITDEARNITFAELETKFAEMKADQEKYTNAEFVDKLGSATADSPLLVGAYGGYGYVYNLLLGVSDEQSTAISEIDKKNKTDAEYSNDRNEILANTKIKDLRSSWILSGYDFDYATKKFTGDYTFTTGDNSLAFQGEVKELNKEDKEYSVLSLKEYGIADFVEFMDNYLYGEVKTDENAGNSDIYKKVTASGAVEYNEKINELLFAFSTDPGSLNTYKGYKIKPAVDGADSEEYVKTFADAGRELLSMGGNSYIIVASDFGYHVMFYSEIISGTGVSLEEYLDATYGEKDWANELNEMFKDWDNYEDTTNFLYTFVNSITSSKVSTALSNKEAKIINQYRYEDSKVEIFEKVYADLLG